MGKHQAFKHFCARICFASLLLAAAACGGGGGIFSSSSPNIEAAEARGREDARKAVEAPAASMQREHAVLEISSRRERLRATGDTAAASAYARAAEAVLDSAGVFD